MFVLVTIQIKAKTYVSSIALILAIYEKYKILSL